MSALQEIAGSADTLPEPVAAPTVAVPRAGEKFRNEDLHARFNVPVWGGIRVSRDKKCIVLVGLAVPSDYNDIDYGRTISYVGQNSDREGIHDQEMSDTCLSPDASKTEPADPGECRMQAASNNLSLSRSKGGGYTVLYFTREWDVGDLRFDSRVECNSYGFEDDRRAGRPTRRIIKFKLRRVIGMPGVAPSETGLAADRPEVTAGKTGAAMGGAATRSGGVDAAPGLAGSAGHAALVLGREQQTTGVQPHAQTPFEAPRRVDRSAALLVPREVHARPDLDYEAVGVYMRDAIKHGGYRAALDYYGSEESEKLDRPWHRFKARGWLLGRLGRYDQMARWLEEAADWPDFDHLLATANSVPRAPYRTPSLWLQAPKPVPRQADYTITFEPVAAACRDTGEVPDYIWAAMLILDATGPICSHAGLGAAAFLVAAGASEQARGTAQDRRYDPRRGARLHGAPVGCHRWIIADIDFDPRPPNGPHYYYDLADEGRAALAGARAAGAPWQKATEDAASGLSAMTLPDLLENACRFNGPLRSLDKMRAELGRLVDAWQARDGEIPTLPASEEDQALVDLKLTAKWFDDGETAGSSLDYLLNLMTIIDSTRAVACEAKPSTGAEAAVLQTLIASIQDMCRRHGREVASTLSATKFSSAQAPCDSARCGEGARQWPLYADTAPAMISDLYYCLAEYCRSRRLAVDPCSLPLSKMLTEEERAVAVAALRDDSLFQSGSD